MDREFWNRNGIMIGVGLLGLIFSSVVLSYQTGQPLLPKIDWAGLLMPLLPGFLAILKAGAIVVAFALVGSLVYIVVIPVRDWLAAELAKRPAKAPKKPGFRYTDYRTAVAAPTMQQTYPRMDEQERRAYAALHIGVRQLLEKHAGGHKAATVEGLLQELDQALARPKVAPAAPASLDWRLIASLLNWARAEPTLRLRATRDAFRAIGIAVPEADVQKGGTFNEWVRRMGGPSPTVAEVPSQDQKQATDNGQGDGRTETEGQEEVEEGRAVKSNEIAKFIIPRIARKRARPERNELT
jgi:hypothetical protein